MKYKKEKLEQIIKAGTDEFLCHGYEATSMHNIAKNAEVSKRTLYKYYATKEELLHAIIGKLLDKMLTYCQLEYEPNIDFKMQLDEVIDSRIEFLTSKDFTQMSKLTLSELIRGRKLIAEHMNKIAKIDGHFIDWLDAAKKDNKVSSKYSSFFISGQIHSLIKGEVFYPVITGFITPEDINVKEFKDFLIQFFLHFFCQYKGSFKTP